jgi:hypothetical protein
MLIIVTLLVGSLGSVREIVKEQAIYRRERMVSVRVLPYVMSKVSIGLVYAAYSAGMLFLLQILRVDFSFLSSDELLQLFMAVFLATFSGVLIGLLVSAISATEERAMLLIIAVIIPQFLFSGALPIEGLGGVREILTAPVSAKWAYAAMATTAKIKTGECAAADLSDCHVPGLKGQKSIEAKHSLLQSLDPYGGIFNVDVPRYLGAMAVLAVIFLLLVIIIQKRKDVV